MSARIICISLVAGVFGVFVGWGLRGLSAGESLVLPRQERTREVAVTTDSVTSVLEMASPSLDDVLEA
jgi:hypothetical protein